MRVYKPSGIKWLGEIPKHWEVKKIKYIYKSINGFTPDTSNASYYDNFNGYDWITISDINKKYVNESEVKVSQKYIDKFHPQVTPKGSLLYSFKLSVGLVAFAKKDIYTNEAVLSFLNTNDVDLNFLYYSSFLIQFNAKENIYGAKLLNKELINNAFMVFPPLQEQKEIAAFLDSKCEKIQNYIEKKQKLITLLQEKKQALINEVVTKGLNPNIEFKNSDIEYLGLIPHHWEVRRMKFMASIHNGREQTEIADENGIYPIYGSGGILGKSMYFIYDKPSVLLGRKGTIDKPLFVEEPFWTIDTMFYTSISKIVLPKYFYYLCLTIDFQFYISGSAIPSMTQYDLANISFALPPLQEQKQIANFLDEKCEKINSAIEKTKRQIELIKKYKNTLINEAVCGRINLQKKERI
ncbi:restriction endonuclease subunit S [Campylobacter upsaliensis]